MKTSYSSFANASILSYSPFLCKHFLQCSTGASSLCATEENTNNRCLISILIQTDNLQRRDFPEQKNTKNPNAVAFGFLSGSPSWTRTNDPALPAELLRNICVGVSLLSQAASSQVSSAPVSLTSVFGMGTGGPSP